MSRKRHLIPLNAKSTVHLRIELHFFFRFHWEIKCHRSRVKYYEERSSSQRLTRGSWHLFYNYNNYFCQHLGLNHPN